MRALHAGCGGERLPEGVFDQYEEVRLDIDPQHEPDILCDLLNISNVVPKESFEAAYCCHTLEHLYPHEVYHALRGFWDALKPEGMLMIVVPDLEGIKPTTDVVYMSASGPVCGLDMYYGSSRIIPVNPYMAHHCGFVSETLKGAMETAGFSEIHVERSNFNLVAIGKK